MRPTVLVDVRMKSRGELTIGELAERFGLATHVLRHWESMGLIEPARRAGGQRRYGRDALVRVALILRGKEAGLGLRELSAVPPTRTDPCEAVLACQFEGVGGRGRTDTSRTTGVREPVHPVLHDNPPRARKEDSYLTTSAQTTAGRAALPGRRRQRQVHRPDRDWQDDARHHAGPRRHPRGPKAYFTACEEVLKRPPSPLRLKRTSQTLGDQTEHRECCGEPIPFLGAEIVHDYGETLSDHLFAVAQSDAPGIRK